MWLVSLPVQIGLAEASSLSVLHYVGVLIWVVGFMFESLGDYQLARFKSTSQSAGKVLDQGLWRYSRHPNYFGNALIWLGHFFDVCYIVHSMARYQSHSDDILVTESVRCRVAGEEPGKSIPGVSRLHQSNERVPALATQSGRSC